MKGCWVESKGEISKRFVTNSVKYYRSSNWKANCNRLGYICTLCSCYLESEYLVSLLMQIWPRLLIMVVSIFILACQVERPPLVIEVTGDDYYWHLRYPGPDGVLHTEDDIRTVGDLHLPAGKTAEIKLTSADYLYLFALPELELSQVAVPDLSFSLVLKVDNERTYRLEGDQMCGFSHDSLMGSVFVQSKQEFEDWMQHTASLQ